jgi:hypothetical protein
MARKGRRDSKRSAEHELQQEKLRLEVRDLKRPWWRVPRYVVPLAVALIGLVGLIVGPLPFSDSAKKRTFRLTDNYSDELKQAIMVATDLEYDPSDDAAFTFRFTHPPFRTANRAGYYLFDGGSVVLFVNNVDCGQVEELSLPSWPDQPGNQKETLEKELEDTIAQLVEANREIVVQAILECISHEG